MKFEPVDGRIEKPGAYLMSATDYHADPCPAPSLSCSVARVLIDQSPLHARCKHPRLTPQEPEEFNAVMAVGSAVHAKLLGRGREVREVIAYNKKGEASDNYMSADAKEQRDAALAEGCVPLLPHQVERVDRIVAAARSQLVARAAKIGIEGEGVAEVAVCVIDSTGAWSRIMVDWWDAGLDLVYDVKTTAASCAPHLVPMQLARMDYAFQLAFYERAIATLEPSLAGRLRFHFIMQEAARPPFGLVEPVLSEMDVAVARRRVSAAFQLWNRCLETHTWPGYPPGPLPVQLPPFASNAWLEREAMAQEDPSGVSDWVLAGDRLGR